MNLSMIDLMTILKRIDKSKNGVVVQDEFMCLWFFITLFNLNRFSNLRRLIILFIKKAIIKKYPTYFIDFKKLYIYYFSADNKL